VTFLVDIHLTGQATLLRATLAADGWIEMVSLRLYTFAEVGLPIQSTDRTVWRFAQSNHMILITANRNMEGPNSLERTIREENTPDSYPVVTIGDVHRLNERGYRERCCDHLAEIAFDLTTYLGVGRLYVL
jgi:hypothetical protein